MLQRDSFTLFVFRIQNQVQCKFPLREKKYYILFLRYISFFPKKFRACDFLKTTQLILVKLSDMISTDVNIIRNFLFSWRHFHFWDIDVLVMFRGSACPVIFSLTIEDIDFISFRNWSRKIVDASLSIHFCLTRKALKLAWT